MSKSADTPQSKRVGRLATGALTAVLALSGLAATAGLAGAAPAPGLQPITDYSTYPPALPDGCPGGAAALVNLSFSNGRGTTTSNLAQLPIMHDDTVTMKWDDFAAGCKGPDGSPSVTVALAAYHAEGPTFDMTKDEQLLPGWVGCGPGGSPCQRVGNSYQLILTAPGTKVACNMQIDALLGSPLQVVGPHGSYYSNIPRVDQRPNMLVSAANFGVTNCVETGPVETTVVSPKETPAAAPAEVAPIVAAATTTTAPTTTAAPAVAPAEVMGIMAARELPQTGAQHTGTLAGLGAALLAVGALLVTQSRRFGRRPAN
jgi:LPXTG-motif cell wall-anchored protein